LSGKLGRLFPKEYYGVDGADRLLAEINMRRTVKIRQTGNASGITLPKKWLRELNWSEGDFIRLRLDKSRGLITLQKATIPGGSK
jgi:antitoxin component of MazEF toxin-antitoxin module